MNNLYGFELVKEQEIPELQTLGKLYRHTKTGASLFSLENDDENKVFGITFRTTPHDSTGVAHILEHSVLAGSEKYPVKEPFIELVKGSLQTFVNAFTYPDKTCYPCASQNLKDFYNLVDVYFDAVFHPLISRHTFEQEGWHYELDALDAEMGLKGVVFNEMKGAYSNPDSLLEEVIIHTLFPDNLYRFDSGGHPRHIPDLTYEQFKQFHATYYHPANSRIYWYGDDDPDERLRRTAEVLEGFNYLKVDSDVPLQKPFRTPVKVTQPYAVSPDEAPKYYTTTNWMVGEQKDPEKALALGILNHILIGSQASPLRKALIDSGLGEDLIGGGLETALKQMTFSVGLKGVKPDDVDKVNALIEDTLIGLVENGIDPEMIAASMNTVEFALRENNTGRFPRGLSLMLGALNTWLHDGDPFESLQYEAPLAAVKAHVDAGECYFEGFIRELLVDNPHKAVVTLAPDAEMNRREAEEEVARIKTARDKMSPAELEAIVQDTAELKRLQETPNSEAALATLPVLTLADLDKQNKLIPSEAQELGGVPGLYHDLFTNGILYLDLVFDLQTVPQELLPYFQLFTGGSVKMGTESEDFVALSQRIGRETGGISPSLLIQDKYKSKEIAAKLVVRAKATVDKVTPMLDILYDILLTTKYDNQARFRQILNERKARMEASLVPSGHSVVNRRLRAGHSLAGWLSEEVHGIDNLEFTRNLLKQIEEDWDSVAAVFARIRQLVVDRAGMLLNITLDQEHYREIKPQLDGFAQRFPVLKNPAQKWQPKVSQQGEGFVIPAQVNYVGKGANIYDLGYKHDSSISVILKYLSTTYLWDKIRIMGGAYGVMAPFDLFSGSLNMLSYRDPNLLESLASYDGTAEFLNNFDLTQGELVKAIIGTIGDMDQYLLPDAKGFTSLVRHLVGYSDGDRQTAREQVLGADEHDFRNLATVFEQVAKRGRVVVVGAADAIEQANQKQAGLLDVKKLL